MIEVSEIRRAISLGECESVEFKAKFHTDCGGTLAAFANDYAGRGPAMIIVGVEKPGRLVGVSQDKDEVQRLLADTCRVNNKPEIFPESSFVFVDGLEVFAIRVSRSAQRPHRCKGKCYIRLGSTTREATLAEENEISAGALRLPFDMTPVLTAGIEELNLESFHSYYSATRSSEALALDSRKPEEIADALEFVTTIDGKKRPTVSAILLFGKNPQRFFPASSINAIRFRGLTRGGEILTRQEIKGTADQLIRDGAQFVKVQMLITSQFHGPGVKRTDIEEYPEQAIREAVANAVIHRDYSNSGTQIDIYMFDDRVEIMSPGSLAGGLTVEDLGRKRHLRNPKIAEVLFELKYVEKAGTGIIKMRESLQRNGSAPPEFRADSNSVLVIVKAHPFYTARRRLEEAQRLRIAGEPQRAVELLTQATEINPNYADAYFALAVLFEDLGRFAEARKNYQRATDISSTFTPAFLSWAKMEDRVGNVSAARSIYEKAVNASPWDAAASHAWAMMEKRLGNIKKAFELLVAIEAKQPNNPIVLQSLGQIELIRQHYADAAKYLNRALQRAEEDYNKAWILCDLARLYEATNRPFKETQATYEHSLNLNPSSGETHRFYAGFLNKIGQKEMARRHSTLARELGFREPRKRTGFRGRPGRQVHRRPGF